MLLNIYVEIEKLWKNKINIDSLLSIIFNFIFISVISLKVTFLFILYWKADIQF